MRFRFPQFHVMTVVAGLVMGSAMGRGSAWAQEGRTPRPRTEPMRDAPPPPAAHPAPAYTPPYKGPSSMGIEGRTPRPRPRSLPGTDESMPRVTRVHLYPDTRIVMPPPWTRCTTFPDMGYWRRRDLLGEIQWLSRTGSIPVTPLGGSVEALTDYAQMPAGWRAYGISVPVGGTVQVEVQHTMLGWFRLLLVDKWGKPGPGMLQAAIAYRPVMVTYKNPGQEATAIYVLVDDPAWWSGAQTPYTLRVRRDWDPAKTDLSQVKMVSGLWGASPSVSAEFRGPSLTGPAVYPW